MIMPKSTDNPKSGQAPTQAPVKTLVNPNQKPKTTSLQSMVTGRSPYGGR
jgi:hypothetical protein